MLGDPLLFSDNINRVSEQGGIGFAGWQEGIGPKKAIQLGWGPCKEVLIQCPIWTTATPGAGNPWNILVGSSQFQTIEMTPGVVQRFPVDRVEYLWVIRQFDYTAVEPDNTTTVRIGFWGHADPPSAMPEAQGTQNQRLYERFMEQAEKWKFWK